MKISKHEDGKLERNIIIAMIVDRAVLGSVAQKWDGQLFGSRWGNLIGDWCVEFYKKYRKAPGQDIEGIYDQWASRRRDEDTKDMVEKLLQSLSGQWQRTAKTVQADYILDLAATQFTKVRVAKLREQIEGLLDDGDVSEAVKEIKKFHNVEMGQDASVDLLTDHETMELVMNEQSRKPLIKYPGALGRFFKGFMTRDSFIAFEGPEKRGKTGLLLDTAWRGMEQGRKVAFFEIGDLSRNQILRRFYVRAAGRPFHATDPNDPDTIVQYPISLLPPEGNRGEAQVTCEERKYNKPLDGAEAAAALTKIQRKTKGSIRVAAYPNNSISVSGIQSVVNDWNRDGWHPDVIIIDYADLLLPMGGGKLETRDQIDLTWKSLRGMSQTEHCLLVTASQTDAASYDTDLIGMGNFSGDKRKNAHVTGMIGMNQKPTEKDNGILRLNWVALREGKSSIQKCCHVAGCLALARPVILSVF